MDDKFTKLLELSRGLLQRRPSVLPTAFRAFVAITRAYLSTMFLASVAIAIVYLSATIAEALGYPINVRRQAEKSQAEESKAEEAKHDRNIAEKLFNYVTSVTLTDINEIFSEFKNKENLLLSSINEIAQISNSAVEEIRELLNAEAKKEEQNKDLPTMISKIKLKYQEKYSQVAAIKNKNFGVKHASPSMNFVYDKSTIINSINHNADLYIDAHCTAYTIISDTLMDFCDSILSNEGNIRPEINTDNLIANMTEFIKELETTETNYVQVNLISEKEDKGAVVSQYLETASAKAKEAVKIASAKAKEDVEAKKAQEIIDSFIPKPTYDDENPSSSMENNFKKLDQEQRNTIEKFLISSAADRADFCYIPAKEAGKITGEVYGEVMTFDCLNKEIIDYCKVKTNDLRKGAETVKSKAIDKLKHGPTLSSETHAAESKDQLHSNDEEERNKVSNELSEPSELSEQLSNGTPEVSKR